MYLHIYKHIYTYNIHVHIHIRIYILLNRHLGCLQVLVMKKRAAVNARVYIF